MYNQVGMDWEGICCLEPQKVGEKKKKRLYSTRMLLLPWDTNRTSYSRCFLLSSEVKWSEVAQSCPTLRDPMDCSLQGSSVHGIFQAKVLEWVAISSNSNYSLLGLGCPFVLWFSQIKEPHIWSRFICQENNLKWEFETHFRRFGILILQAYQFYENVS